MRPALLLDFNGVLVDDEELHRQCFNVVLAPLGITMTPALYLERYLGFDDRGAFEAALRDHGQPAEEARVRALIDAKARAYAERAAAELRFFPGAGAFVQRAAGHFDVLVVSGALASEIELALGLLGVRSLVQHVVPAESVSRCKPDPEGYLAALTWLRARGPVDPRRCFALEDSAAGLHSARAAGVRALAVAHTLPRAELWAAGAERVWDHLAQVELFQLLAL